jgi:hypothetical protein
VGTVRSLATLCLVASLASGCALGISAPNPDRPRNEVPECDTGKGAVALDGLWATLSGLGAIAAFGDGEGGTGIALAGVAALFTATAVRGNGAANECRAAYDEFALENRRQPPNEFVAERPVLPAPVKKKPKPPKKVEPPSPDEIRVPDEEFAKPEPPPPEYASPRPPPVVTPVKPAPAPKKPAKQEPADDDDWSSFWKEQP